MPLIAERFLVEDEEIVDLATGEPVRLSLDADLDAARSRARAALCDRLFALRHPLLVPLIDYGAGGGGWFEAHALLPALRVAGDDARRFALHLVRFLRAAGVELDAASAARNVRPAIESGLAARRPIGVWLQPRASLDAVRTILESGGPPGVTAITIHAGHGAGLRTARLQVARAARLAGYLVIDSRFGAIEEALVPPRHLCAFDWLARDAALPPVLAFAAAAGARRHAWIRFCRNPAAGAGAVGLEPLMTRDLTNAIYLDAECGPSAGEVRSAIALGNGYPGGLIDALSRVRGSRGASWVHETAPEYALRPRQAAATLRPPTGGVARLERAVEAAQTLAIRGRHARAARVLARCGAALAARGAGASAAAAACALGELHLDRGRPDEAAAAFQRARTWSADAVTTLRGLIGSGRALLEQGRLIDAESVFRTACVADARPRSQARRWLAETLVLRGRVEAAEEALADADPALLSTIARLQGDLPRAARAAALAIEQAATEDGAPACSAHLAMAHVQTAMGATAAVRQHTAAAEAAARRSGTAPAFRLRATAEALSCLQRCGMARPAVRARLIRAARRLPPLAAARVRCPLDAATTADGALICAPGGGTDLIHRFHTLLATIHDACDERTALQAIAADLLEALDACSVVVRSAVLGRAVASAGRSWHTEEALTRPVLDGSGTIFRDGVTPEAAEPILAGGSILGSMAIRWVSGARPSVPRVRDVARVSAAAAAHLLRALHVPPRSSAPDVSYPDDLLGPGPAAERVREAIRRAASAPYAVLIEGESGCGKELVARAIHARSPRRARKFCAVNCAALTDDLLEAELFGHARGAFTGAVSDRPGLFEEADQGTIFLDEAGELTARAQAKLLRVLQEGEIRRVGENLPRRVDTRVVAATNRPLAAEVAAGRFRADLRFRLDVIRIAIPPLRERPDDVPWLVERIWSDAAARVGTRATLGGDVIGALARYDWPGNVRELQNVVAALAVHGPRRGRVPASVLPVHIAGAALHITTSIDEARIEFERRFVRAALARAGGRRTRAAAQLGVSRQGLAKIIKRLGIESAGP